MFKDTILRLPEVMVCTGLSRSAIYEKMRNGEFPASVKLGARAVGWVAEEVTAHNQRLIEESRKGGN